MMDLQATQLSQKESKMESWKKSFHSQDQFLMIDSFVDPGLLSSFAQEAQRLSPKVNRNFVPGFKKGGSIDSFTLKKEAPIFHELYQSPALIEWVSELTGKKVELCPKEDPHACALYYYTEAGDHIGYHYDTSHYKGERFTVLVSISNQSSCEFECDLFKKTKTQEVQHIKTPTKEGCLVIFNGDNIWHRITPMKENENRVMLTLEYVTDPRMSWLGRQISNIKDSVAYFGWKTLFKKKPISSAS